MSGTSVGEDNCLGKKERFMLRMKCCRRCVGDMIHENTLDGGEWVCIQCGNRFSAPATPASTGLDRELRFDRAVDRDLCWMPRATQPAEIAAR